jgi:iron complex transport system substrate-binding protein
MKRCSEARSRTIRRTSLRDLCGAGRAVVRSRTIRRTSLRDSGRGPTNWRFSQTLWQVSLLLVIVAAGCEKAPRPGGAAKSRDSQAPSERVVAKPDSSTFPRTVVDGLKRTVTLDRRPERIVSLAPKNTELLFAVGAGGRLVGVTSYCNYPLEALQREKIGGFSSKSISLEKVVALRPDLVVSAGKIHAPIIAELERLQIPVIALGAESFDDMFEDVRILGTLVGHEQQATQLIEQMQTRVRLVREVGRSIASPERVSVFYMTWDEPLTAAGPGSYAGQMIDICGGANAISDVSTAYPQISQEVLLDRDPDVIIAATMTSLRWTAETLRSKTGWNDLKAVRTGRLHLLDGDAVSRCGPRLVDVLESMAHVLYPHRFPEPSKATEPPDRNEEGESLP